jgi:hypothetical protein
MRQLRDLGLTYEQALHGLQTAVLHDMNMWEANNGRHLLPERIRTEDRHPNGPKHLRVGHDCRASDHMALASLLIEKGIITEEEYIERVRLALNDELAGREENHPGVKFR